MALVKHVMVTLLFLSAVFGITSGTVYEVGDPHGWNNDGSVNYMKWASTKNFHLGDIIRFTYNPLEHDVMLVSCDSFLSCNSSDPVYVRISGNDSFPITGTGHYYYICGVPGHCEASQKVDIRVVKPSGSSPRISPRSSPTPAPTEEPLGPPPSAGNAPSLPKSNAAPTECHSLAPLAFQLSVAVGFLALRAY